ncbi:3-oxoacyl-ACP reductase family protein [Levilactobacillus brevis]|uniref:3-oxoacyl-ACP reductase family protein n=1 Tax=Levilactobacillus brevis TaxID=1580 RepID=UPI000A2FD0F6|nr:3-oxoacyl-ACP reductase family protein [Levilactobacillus brevis]ARQ93878.1 beta-ketoacyl-ACP reductase [Levilactobacillus brevis]
MTEQRVAIVTGAGTGIGFAIAEQFLKVGIRVILNIHHELAPAEQTIIDQYSTAIVVTGDVTQETTADELVTQAMNHFGRLDILINNAGITRDKLLTRMAAADFTAVMTTNVFGAFNLTKAAMKVMQKARQGAIVNLSSISGLHGNIGQANYAASKAAIVGLTKASAKEGALRQIRVNAIAPGMIATAMTGAMSEKRQAAAREVIPLKRFGTVAEIATTALFLVNNAYITGQVITVDGGLTI